MMFGYINNDFSTGTFSEEVIDIFLEVYNKIKEKFQFINKKEEILLVDNSLSSIDLMVDSFNKLVDVLESNSLFQNEFLLSISIIADIESIIYLDVLKENINFVVNVVINFCNLISTKQDWILSDKNFNYDKQYEDFVSFYIDQQCNFLRTLPKYDENDEDDEAIVRVANMLW